MELRLTSSNLVDSMSARLPNPLDMASAASGERTALVRAPAPPPPPRLLRAAPRAPAAADSACPSCAVSRAVRRERERAAKRECPQGARVQMLPDLVSLFPSPASMQRHSTTPRAGSTLLTLGVRPYLLGRRLAQPDAAPAGRPAEKGSWPSGTSRGVPCSAAGGRSKGTSCNRVRSALLLPFAPPPPPWAQHSPRRS